jgi:Mlc titration factor MtfA (ptsG expression regulator)
LFFLLLATAALLLVSGLLAWPWWVARRRARWRAHPFPALWRRILRKRVPYVALLPWPLQQRLQSHMLVFLAEKPFLGCAGMEVDDEVRVTIAAQACLLLLGRPDDAMFPQLRQVLVYPGAFVVERSLPLGGGVVQDQRRHLAGESWQQGQVLLSWDDVLRGAADPSDGHNVVLHEFAHQLDQDGGNATGIPLVRGGPDPAQWTAVFERALQALQRDVALGREGIFDAYGATDAVEFFAVATECFFERAAAMAEAAPEVFEALRSYYAVDPRAWQ